ncbi:MAG: hypothetical protein DWQ02_09925 [Bacteroidetes bacterium]|nr:MAG: hypothetical protein DWQ02_09925 [Bacteroidota bacterium]
MKRFSRPEKNEKKLGLFSQIAQINAEVDGKYSKTISENHRNQRETKIFTVKWKLESFWVKTNNNGQKK